MNILEFFTDPVLRAPTIGSILMCFAASLVGVLVFIRKASLLGETLSHACYPGVTLAVIFAGALSLESASNWIVLVGAFVSSLLGFFLVYFLQKKMKVSSDSALCFVLAFFFGGGVLAASFAQFFYPHFFRQIQAYLYGQVATMTDLHIFIYGVLSFLIVLILVLFYKEILTASFDPLFSKSARVHCLLADILMIFLTTISIVIGIRSVGVILMSAMLIAPAVSARQFTNKLTHMFVLAGLFGILSGFFGSYLSCVFSKEFSFATGPMIVLVASCISLYALLCAPKRGLLIRYARIAHFRHKTLEENLIKAIWRLNQGKADVVTFSSILELTALSKIYVKFLLWKFKKRAWLSKQLSGYILTPAGLKKGGQIVRLHRLWEAYLVHSLGLKVERVHKSAEEMEHIITPELERRLTELLDDPKQDPHDQPIPGRDEVMHVS